MHCCGEADSCLLHLIQLIVRYGMCTGVTSCSVLVSLVLEKRSACIWRLKSSSSCNITVYYKPVALISVCQSKMSVEKDVRYNVRIPEQNLDENSKLIRVTVGSSVALCDGFADHGRHQP